MNKEDYKTAELDLKRIARIRALGIMALAWLVSDVLYLLHVVATRMIVSGQVSSDGLEVHSVTSHESLKDLEQYGGLLIALVACIVVGFRALKDLQPQDGATVWTGPRPGSLDWWWSFTLPVLIGLAAFGVTYYYGYTAAFTPSRAMAP